VSNFSVRNSEVAIFAGQVIAKPSPQTGGACCRNRVCYTCSNVGTWTDEIPPYFDVAFNITNHCLGSGCRTRTHADYWSAFGFQVDVDPEVVVSTHRLQWNATNVWYEANVPGTIQGTVTNPSYSGGIVACSDFPEEPSPLKLRFRPECQPAPAVGPRWWLEFYADNAMASYPKALFGSFPTFSAPYYSRVHLFRALIFVAGAPVIWRTHSLNNQFTSSPGNNCILVSSSGNLEGGAAWGGSAVVTPVDE
jgi:hypothetical protein